jgi:plasmid stabilization system protein ParE
MIEKIAFTSEAEVDFAEAYDWYESREPGLGEDFLRSVEACLRTIQRYPQLFPVAGDEFRHAPIRRFPFEIFYEPGDDCLTIYSIFHCSQDPQRWRKRLGLE